MCDSVVEQEWAAENPSVALPLRIRESTGLFSTFVVEDQIAPFHPPVVFIRMIIALDFPSRKQRDFM
jgi:hypothetical protein